MLIGTLSAQTLYAVYLRGIHLGSAWSGPQADAAINTLLLQQVAHAEALMNIHFQRWRVATLPETLPGDGYDVLGQAIPYHPLPPGETVYRLKLLHHDVHAVTRVRVFLGWSADVVPVPLMATLPLEMMTFPMAEERLHVPADLVTTTPLAWAVDYQMGLAMLPAEIEEWCALGVAIEVLSLAGSGADVSGGVSSSTLEMDGITEKNDFGGSGALAYGGIYGGPITILRERRADIDLVALRFRYQNTLGDRVHLPAGSIIPQRTPFYALTP
jgi:hypothetical protein